jgi:hypothetical protein
MISYLPDKDVPGTNCGKGFSSVLVGAGISLEGTNGVPQSAQ